jgi:hypothetical protein
MLAGEAQLLCPALPQEACHSRNQLAKDRRSADSCFGVENDFNRHLKSRLEVPINDDSSWDFAGNPVGSRLVPAEPF